MSHLLVDLSAHGYGHVSQTAPVVNELARRIPALRVTLRCAAPLQLLRQRFHCDFKLDSVALDFGMKMASAVDVEVKKSAAAYRAYHAEWETKVSIAAEQMRALHPDLLLANVPYLSLAAAHATGIRAVGMCCLNWADIFHHYCPDDAAIHAQMQDAYNSAEIFLKVQPAMDMPDLNNARNIGPIAQIGHNRRSEITRFLPPCRGKDRMGVGHLDNRDSTPTPTLPLQGGGSMPEGALVTRGDEPQTKLILVAMGGIDFRLPMENWPLIEDVRWLVPQAWNIKRDDMIAFEPLGLPFGDLLASCDAVLTKPGYGTFAEAACAGVPVIYVSRGDWPEEPYLVKWLEQNAVCRKVERSRLQKGEFEDLLHEVFSQAKPPVPVASGTEEAAEILAGML